MEVVPYPAQTVHLWLARHIPEWMFVICHPGLEKAGAEDPYFMFRVFPDRARFGEPDWFVHEDIEGNWGGTRCGSYPQSGKPSTYSSVHLSCQD
jgi:hypothetical protein